MKILIFSIITFVLAAIVLAGVAGIDNVLAQQPRKSTFDQVFVNISEAEPTEQKESISKPVPEEFVELIQNIN